MTLKFIVISTIFFSVSILHSCRDRSNNQNSENKDLVTSDRYYWAEGSGENARIYSATCPPENDSPRSKYLCKSDLRIVLESKLTEAVKNGQIGYTIGRSFDEAGGEQSALQKIMLTDTTMISLFEKAKKASVEFNEVEDNRPKIEVKRPQFDELKSKFNSVAASLAAHKRNHDLAELAIHSDANDRDALSLKIESNEKIQELSPKYNALKTELEPLQKEFDEFTNLSSAAKKKLDDIRNTQEKRIQELLANIRETSEYKQQVIDFENRKSNFIKFRDEVYPMILAKIKRTNFPIRLENQSAEIKHVWVEYVEKTFMHLTYKSY